MTRAEVERIVHEVLPRILEEYPEFRSTIEKIVRERGLPREEAEARFERMMEHLDRQYEELRRMREESERRWQESQKRWEELKAESERKWQESQKRWEELKKESEKQWQALWKEIHRLDHRIEAFGARWGIFSEGSYRRAMAEILAEYSGCRVERYLAYDREGEVFGHPDQVEIDLIVRDGEILAAEIKSSISKADVYFFNRKVDFYEKHEGRRVKHRVIISPWVRPEARQVAQKLGIRIFSHAHDLEESEL